jgi:hypothetical protein
LKNLFSSLNRTLGVSLVILGIMGILSAVYYTVSLFLYGITQELLSNNMCVTTVFTVIFLASMPEIVVGLIIFRKADPVPVNSKSYTEWQGLKVCTIIVSIALAVTMIIVDIGASPSIWWKNSKVYVRYLNEQDMQALFKNKDVYCYSVAYYRNVGKWEVTFRIKTNTVECLKYISANSIESPNQKLYE